MKLTLQPPSLPTPSDKFIEENKKLKFTNSRKGGPYSKEQRDKRQAEVVRLHFDYGYNARKIAKVLGVNRNTINRDLNYLYAKVYENNDNIMNPEAAVMLNIQRLEIQRTRLREELDKAKSFRDKIIIERMISMIDCKISDMYIRVSESGRRLLRHGVMCVNLELEKEKSEKRYLTESDKISVKSKTLEKINKLIKHDKVLSAHNI